MTSLEDATWKEVKLIDLFDMHTGRYYPVKSFKSGKTPLITAKSINNGINYFTDLPPRFPAGCLTIGKVGMDIFYQYTPFVASSDVTILTPKFPEYNSYIGKFIAVSARQQSSVFGYGNQIRLNDSMKIKILLPVDTSDAPDWKMMESYMKQLEKKILDKTISRFNSKVTPLNNN